jgi:sulfite reductase alpha subunit
MNSIQRSDMAIIGTWRDNMRTDDALGKKWFAKHGLNELVNDVIGMCPTRAVQLKDTKDVSKEAHISSVKLNDTQSLEISNKDCVRCMHCINVMTGALAKGKDTGATILVGGKSHLKIGATMGTVVVPFFKLQSDEDYEALVELGQTFIDFFAENALEHERTGEMIERIGLVNFLEGCGLDVDANMVNNPRMNPYVRMDDWDEEVAKINAKKTAA